MLGIILFIAICGFMTFCVQYAKYQDRTTASSHYDRFITQEDDRQQGRPYKYLLLDMNEKEAESKGVIGADSPAWHATSVYFVLTKGRRIHTEAGKHQMLLIDIDFKPNIRTETTGTVSGRAGSALVGGMIAGPVGAAIGASRKKKVNVETTTTEVREWATLTFKVMLYNEYVTYRVLLDSETCDTLRYEWLTPGYY